MVPADTETIGMIAAGIGVLATITYIVLLIKGLRLLQAIGGASPREAERGDPPP